MTLQKQLEYVHPEVLVDTQWVEVEVDYDSSRGFGRYTMGRGRGRLRF